MTENNGGGYRGGGGLNGEKRKQQAKENLQREHRNQQGFSLVMVSERRRSNDCVLFRVKGQGEGELGAKRK